MKLRALEIEDLPFLYQWENDAAAWCDSETHNPLSHHLLREYIEQSAGDIFKDGQVRLIIEEDGQTMGCIDLFDLDARSRKAAIGMYIAPEQRGNGIGKKAVELLREYAFGFLNLHMIYAIIAEDNASCLKIYQQVGFTESATLHDWILRNGQYIAAHCFQLCNPQ